MDQHGRSTLGRRSASPSSPRTTVMRYGAAGTILVLGTISAYLMMRAGPEALAATSKALIATGLAGLFLMTVVGVRRSWPGRHGGGGHGGRGNQPPGPVPAAPMDEIDAEFFRIIGGEGLGNIRATPSKRPAAVPADMGVRTRRGSPC